MPLDVFLFDLDGTLIDSAADLATAVNLLRRELSLDPLSIDAVRGMVGDGATMLVRRALPDDQFSPDRLDRFIYHYRAHLLDQTRVYPEIADFLMAHQGKKMAVVTNKPADLAGTLLFELGLLPFLSCLVGGDSGLPKKPDPAPIFQALRELQADPERAVLFGDHHTDLNAGRAAGIRTCFCAYGFGRADDAPWDFRAEQPADLLRLFPPDRPA